MTLDEVIEYEKESLQHCKRKLEEIYEDNLENKILKFEVKQHEQLAKWLEELKFIRQWKSDVMEEFCRYDVSSFEELVTNARNNAIDDFVKEICKMIVQSENNGNYRFYAVEIKQAIADLAEQLKEGVAND